jgi:kinesin family protein 5
MEPIKVIVRVRPLDEQTNLQNQGPETVQISPDCQEIHLETPLLKHGSKSSKYDFVLGPNSSQEDVYSHIKGCVDSVVKGYNGCILAYGQTGSGKTYSMFGKSPGSHQALKYGGIIPRCIHEIFSVSQRDRHHLTSYNVYVSFIQVYNEQVYDLFSDSKNYQPLTIHETWPPNSGDIKRGHSVKVKPCSIIVAGLSELKVRNVKECMTLLQMGIKNRNIRETSMNNASSRSHSIFQILVEQERKHLDPKNPQIVSSVTHSLCSKLSLVDLAGSERWNMYRDSHIEDNINSSLHTLGRCVWRH